jgi:hypothetical protein
LEFGQVYLRANEDKQKAGMKFLNFFVSEFGAKGNCNPFGITKRQKRSSAMLRIFCWWEYAQVYLKDYETSK